MWNSKIRKNVAENESWPRGEGIRKIGQISISWQCFQCLSEEGHLFDSSVPPLHLQAFLPPSFVLLKNLISHRLSSYLNPMPPPLAYLLLTMLVARTIFMSSKFMRLCHLMYIILYGWPYQLFVITFIYNVVNSKNVQRLLIYCLLSFSVEIFLWGDEFFPVGLWIIWEVIKILLETFTTVNDEFWYFLSCKNPQREGECYL